MNPVVEEARVRETEVVEKARRRGFTAQYKLRVLAEADRCTKPGEVGALLRREGLYSSLLSAWRRQRDAVSIAEKRRWTSSPVLGVEAGAGCWRT